TPGSEKLTRIPAVIDQTTLEALIRSGLARRARGRTEVELLWQCCQIPDYRDISPALHADLITAIFSDILDHGKISQDWIAEQVRFCDNASGDIDTLSNRIRQIRTWTFVANKKDWLDDPAHWREQTSDIENRLSDALHDRLVQRFVDRRTSVLLRHLRDRSMVDPEINETGQVSLEGHLIGSIEGFRFKLAPSDGEADAKALRAAATAVVAPELKNRAARLAAAPNDQILLSTDGFLRYKGEIVAELAEGDDIFAPRILLLADDALAGPERTAVEDRLALWLRHAINTQLEQVKALLDPAELDGAARGVAYRLAEHLGVMPRSEVADDVRNLDQDVRGRMRKLGIKFGAYHIYVPQSLKPAPRELALILYALKHGGVRQPGVSDLPGVVLVGRTSFETDPAIDKRLYEIAGFKVAGNRAVRVDILERLADIIRPLIAYDANRPVTDTPAPEGAAEGTGFRVTVDMTSLLGCAGDDFASILKSLGYRLDRRPLPDAPKPEEGAAPAEAETTLANEAPAEATPVEHPDLATVSETAEPAAPEAPKFDEVWFPPRRKPAHEERHARPQKGHDKPRHEEGEGHGRNKGKRRPDRKQHKERPERPQNQKTERREKPFDPDSPFAALAALREKQ
ncbi:MAG: helicase, partial [Hyphomicrobiaceae bacterium]|nr:helicase [Hyphomicrobiaceae bacterium]